MSKIFNYEDVYKKLKNGEDIIPLSREEAFSMALLQKMQGTNNIIDEENNQFAILHNKLINGEPVTPISRDEVFSLALLNELGVTMNEGKLSDWAAGNGIDDATVLNSIAYGNNMFVIVGDGITYYSNDGIKWSVGNGVDSSSELNAVTYGNGKFVAVGQGVAYYSNDGVKWATGKYFNDSDEFLSVTYGNGMFVAVGKGSNSISYYSNDGIEWVYGCMYTSFGLNAVTYGNGMFVAISDTNVYHSIDAKNWTVAVQNLTSQLIYINYVNGLFVASNEMATVKYSEDGINWVNCENEEGSVLYCIAYGDGEYIGCSKDILYFDGDMSITNANCGFVCEGIYAQYKGIVYGNGMFVAVGTDGCIYSELKKEQKTVGEAINELYNITNECLQRIKVLEGGE